MNEKVLIDVEKMESKRFSDLKIGDLFYSSGFKLKKTSEKLAVMEQENFMVLTASTIPLRMYPEDIVYVKI